MIALRLETCSFSNGALPGRFVIGREMTNRRIDTGVFRMTSDKPAFVVPTGTGRGKVLNVFGQTITERITAEDSGGAYYVFDEVTPPGMGVPPHKHSLDDEIVFIIEGEFEVYLDGYVSKASAGAVLNFARGTFHGFRCIGDKQGKTTWVATPGNYTQAVLRNIASMPPGPPDHALMDALRAENGVSMPPPSPNWW
jgi:quercetin dioxygenase-like cupin family protein